MSHLVSSALQVKNNATRFQVELAASLNLQDRLAFARAWYAFPGGDREWSFVPSKFAGYQNMTAAEYLDDAPRDGRRTEKQLAQWFREVPIDCDLHDKLYEELVGFLAAYGKAPSTKARISVLTAVYDEQVGIENPKPIDSAIVDLIVLIAGKLPENELSRLKASL